MQHSGGISHSVEVHKGKAAGRPGEPIQHQPDVFHCRVLGYGHVQTPLTACQKVLSPLPAAFVDLSEACWGFRLLGSIDTWCFECSAGRLYYTTDM